MKGRRQSDKGGGLTDYLIPPRVCATCGKPTSGGRHSSSMGEYHYDCRRDRSGRLIIVAEPNAEAAA
jgi:hypothetical protein